MKNGRGLRVDIRAVVFAESNPPFCPRSIVGYEESLVVCIGESAVRLNKKVAVGKAIDFELIKRNVYALGSNDGEEFEKGSPTGGGWTPRGRRFTVLPEVPSGALSALDVIKTGPTGTDSDIVAVMSY